MIYLLEFAVSRRSVLELIWDRRQPRQVVGFVLSGLKAGAARENRCGCYLCGNTMVDLQWTVSALLGSRPAKNA